MTVPLAALPSSQAAQIGLGAVVAQALEPALAGLDLGSTSDVERLTGIMQALATRYGALAAQLAVQDYLQAREAADIRRPFTPTPAPLPTAKDAQAAVEFTVSGLLRSDTTDNIIPITRAAQKTVMDVARATIVDNVVKDKAAIGYARIPEPEASRSGTCAFCAMLALRGPVYSKTGASFKAHPGCWCHAEQLFKPYQMPPVVLRWKQLWESSTKGRRGADARAAFRQAIEGRPVTGLTRKGAKPTPAQMVAVVPADAHRLIAALEAANRRVGDDPVFAGMVAANRRRIAELRAA